MMTSASSSVCIPCLCMVNSPTDLWWSRWLISYKESVSDNINLGTISSSREITFVMALSLELVSRPISKEYITHASMVIVCKESMPLRVGHSSDLLFYCLLESRRPCLFKLLHMLDANLNESWAFREVWHMQAYQLAFAHCTTFAHCTLFPFYSIWLLYIFLSTS